MNIFKKNAEKHENRLPMPDKVKEGYRCYCSLVATVALMGCCTMTAFAAPAGGDPFTVINNLSDFIFGLIRAVGLYFLLKPCVGTETVSWMYVLGVAPFAVLGFFTYHSMTAEQFLWAWLRSELLEPKQFHFEASPIYYEALKDTIEKEGKQKA